MTREERRAKAKELVTAIKSMGLMDGDEFPVVIAGAESDTVIIGIATLAALVARANDARTIFSGDENGMRANDQTPELRLVVGDKFHTATDGGCHDVWTYAGCRDGEYLIVQEIDGQEYTRVVELVGDTWRCVDDPDEFTGIIHVPANQENR